MSRSKGLTRREFLKLSAAGTAAVTFGGCGDGGERLLTTAPSSTSRVFRVDQVPDLPAELPGPPGFLHPGIEAMLRIMDQKGHPLYSTADRIPLGGPEGLIKRDDVVLIKPNQVAFEYCGTNTELIRGMIQRILMHPDGFAGEVVLFDQYIIPFTPNSVNPLYTLYYVTREFRNAGYRVSVYPLFKIFQDVAHEGPPHRNGFVDLQTDHPEDPLCDCITYPKFTTDYGTPIDLKEGVYNGDVYEDRLRLINMPIMKDHHWMGMSCACKNLFGTTETLTWRFPRPDRWLRNHKAIWETGFFGRLMKKVRKPDLNIVDATRVIYQPPFGPGVSPQGSWKEQKTLLAGFDPVVLDYYAARHVLYPIEAKAPCEGLKENNNCTEPAPCLGSGGHCERHNPHCRCEDVMDETFWSGLLWLRLEGGAPINSLRQYLITTSLALHGEVRLDDRFVDLVHTSL